MPRNQRLTVVPFCIALTVIWAAGAGTQPPPAQAEWRFFGGDKGYKRYAPLDQINHENVAKLQDPLEPARHRRESGQVVGVPEHARPRTFRPGNHLRASDGRDRHRRC